MKDPKSELSEMRKDHPEDGCVTVHFQQKHEGILVVGGELIVNTNEEGDLYSISGEFLANISPPTQPIIDSTQARETTLGAMAKRYEKRPKDFTATEPELMEVTSADVKQLGWETMKAIERVIAKDTCIPLR